MTLYSPRMPRQAYLRKLREDPDPALIGFIRGLKPGVYGITELWKRYNNGCGFHGSFHVFRYAVLHAGLTEEKPGGRLVRSDTLDSSDGQVRPETPGGHP